MAEKNFSELTAKPTIQENDFVAIWDTDAGEAKTDWVRFGPSMIYKVPD